MYQYLHMYIYIIYIRDFSFKKLSNNIQNRYTYVYFEFI